MQEAEVVSHFWVAGSPFFSSTVLVASNSAGSSAASAIRTEFELYDVEGAPVQKFQVEFPEREVGVIELEPFLTGLKMQAGIAQGHLVVKSREGTRHFFRQQIGDQVDLINTPSLIKSREMTFLPLLLGARREHLITLLNAGDDVGQVVVRLMYGTRSPEWTVHVPAYGCRTISLEHELLSTFDDASWQKGVVQGYLRISPRGQSEIVFQMLERLPGETEEKENFRCMTSW
jgi:hypothetical protein